MHVRHQAAHEFGRQWLLQLCTGWVLYKYYYNYNCTEPAADRFLTTNAGFDRPPDHIRDRTELVLAETQPCGLDGFGRAKAA